MNNGTCCKRSCRRVQKGGRAVARLLIGAGSPVPCFTWSGQGGPAWRLLPRDFGPWQTVYHYFRLWSQKGYWQAIHDVFRNVVRDQAGKRSQPTAASWTRRPFVRPTKRASEVTTRPRKPKASNVISWWTRWACLWVCVTPADVSGTRGGPAAFGSPLCVVPTGCAVCGPTKAMAERRWRGWCQPPIARRAPCGWRSCRACKTSVASKCCVNAGLWSGPSAGL